MNRILLALILFLGLSIGALAQTVPLPVTVMNLDFDGTLTNTSATDGGDAKILLDADQGDDNADLWTIQSTAATNNLDFINHVTTVASLSSTGALQVTTSGTVKGAEGGDASAILDADEGDDSGDTWSIVSNATGNTLTIVNEATTLVTVSTTGTVVLAAQATAPGTPTTGTIYVDSSVTPDELCFYDGTGWQAVISGTDGNCA